MHDNLQGVIQTVWSGCGTFMDSFDQEYDQENSEVACFKAMFDVVNSMPNE